MIAFTVPLENARPPAYLDLDKDRRAVKVRELPEREQIPVQAELSLIVEFYSR
jgi:ribosomal protein S4